MVLLHGSGVNGNWMLQSLPFKEYADKHQVPCQASHSSSWLHQARHACISTDSLTFHVGPMPF